MICRKSWRKVRRNDLGNTAANDGPQTRREAIAPRLFFSPGRAYPTAYFAETEGQFHETP